MIGLTLTDRTLSLVSTLFLARVLSPTDFGLVAMATSFILIAQLISAFGFDVALIHRQDATPDHFHTAWTFNVSLGTTIMLISLAAASPLAEFYNEPRVFWTMSALSLLPLISSLENIGVVEFRKELNFRKEFTFQITRRIVGFAVVVPLAIYLRNHWALVAGALATRVAGTIASYLVHSFRPHFSFSKASSLLTFSKWLLLNNVLGFLKERSTDFILGRFSGPAGLGLYNITYEFANLPTTEIGAPINRALLPGFAKLSDVKMVTEVYSNAMAMLAIFAIPASLGVFAVAPYYVATVLGLQWIDGVPMMEILSISSAILVFEGSICAVLIGRGFPHTVARIHIAFVVLLLAALFLLVPRFGVEGAAWAALAATGLTLPIYLHSVYVRVRVSPFAFLRAIGRPIAASGVMVAAVRYLLPEYSTAQTTMTTTLWLVQGALAGITVYTLTVLLLWVLAGRPNGPERRVLDLTKELVRTHLRQTRAL